MNRRAQSSRGRSDPPRSRVSAACSAQHSRCGRRARGASQNSRGPTTRPGFSVDIQPGACPEFSARHTAGSERSERASTRRGHSHRRSRANHGQRASLHAVRPASLLDEVNAPSGVILPQRLRVILRGCEAIPLSPVCQPEGGTTEGSASRDRRWRSGFLRPSLRIGSSTSLSCCERLRTAVKIVILSAGCHLHALRLRLRAGAALRMTLPY
jgi:hypothetical protein